jgi:hypothetical protein
MQARLRFSEEVQQSDVDEGIRLMYESKRSLYEEANPAQRSYDPTSTIFEMAKNVALAADSSTIKVADLEQRALMKGFTRAQMMECIKQYETLSVWMQVSGCHEFTESHPAGLLLIISHKAGPLWARVCMCVFYAIMQLHIFALYAIIRKRCCVQGVGGLVLDAHMMQHNSAGKQWRCASFC